MLTVRVPSTRFAERTYIIRVLLWEFLGLEHRIIRDTVNEATIFLGEDESKTLTIADAFFPMADSQWLREESLPVEPLRRCELPPSLELPVGTPQTIPVLYGSPTSDGSWINYEDSRLSVGIDLFGSSFFMLTRYEELVSEAKDWRGRFPATASLAYREKLLDVPIVNVYLEVLWSAMRALWPTLSRRPREYTVALSHDVDIPLCTVGRGGLRFLKALSGDAIKRRGVDVAVRRTKAFATGRFSNDPCYTFDWIMNQSEAYSLTSSFYFIAGDTGGDIERYNIRDIPISRLMSDIQERGHRLGLHPSYNSYQNPEAIGREFRNLVEACAEHNIYQEEWGGRQHYLRWSAKETWRHWDACGLSYDSSVGFADHVGFRSGCCYAYSTFDLTASEALSLIERPLIVMEGTLLAPHHMGLSKGPALNMVTSLAQQCHRYRGEFTLLWHNDMLVSRESKELYLDAIQIALTPFNSMYRYGPAYS